MATQRLLPDPLARLEDGSNVSWSDAEWLGVPPEELVPLPFWQWLDLHSEVVDLAEQLASWPVWREYFEVMVADLASGVLHESDLDPEDPQLGESMGSWCSRIVIDARQWYTDEYCVRVAPSGEVAQYFCFSDEETLAVLAIRETKSSKLHLFSFCPV